MLWCWYMGGYLQSELDVVLIVGGNKVMMLNIVGLILLENLAMTKLKA